jgi:hypothetical protein
MTPAVGLTLDPKGTRETVMPGYTKDEQSLVTGIPNRTIGPETGSYGNATKTNAGDTGEGTNQQATPSGAAAFDAPKITTDDLGERRSFTSGPTGSARLDPTLPDPGVAAPDLPGGVEPIYQQIADGGDHFDHHKRRGEDRKHERERHERERRERLESERLAREKRD